jgi:hypothetical protein
LADVYEIFYGNRRDALARQIARKEAEYERLVEGFAGLASDKARGVANAKLAALEKEMEELRSHHEPLVEKLDSLYNEVGRVKVRLEVARTTLAGDDNRKKAEALSRVLGSVICHFRHQDGAGRRPSSVLDRVEIVPTSGGESTCYRADLFEENVGYPAPH